MIEIRNLLFQPLTFQLAGEERGLHLGSRQRKLVEDAQVSDEMRTAAKRGFVALTNLNEPEATEENPEAAADTTGQATDETIAQEPALETQESTIPASPDTAATVTAVTESIDEIAAEPQTRKRR